MHMLYPLLLEYRLVPRIWGGQQLGEWLGSPPQNQTNPTHAPAAAEHPIGESWLVYDTNRVQNGPLAGETLANVTRQWGAALVGTRSVQRYGIDFPLLVKFLDVASSVSIQVHPDDAYAHRYETSTGFHGKTEAWYILQAHPGATVVHGLLEPCNRADFAAAVQAEDCEGLLRYLPVQAGDTILVPARTIHAINAGILLYEIQQKSDLTYRVYDYGRCDATTGKPRELHLDKALEVINFDQVPEPPRPVVPLDTAGERVELTTCNFFTLERWSLRHAYGWTTDPATLEIFTVLSGQARLEWSGGSLSLVAGASVVLPAALGECVLHSEQPETQVLRVYIPAMGV